MSPPSAPLAFEAERQQALLQALRDHELVLPPAAVALPGPASAHRLAGLRAYRANAQAIAERALAAACPTVAQLVGEEAMAALARDLWQEHPPQRGDLAWFGGDLADWIAQVPELAEWPYLADVARLDWAVHRAQFAADPGDTPGGLAHLASDDPAGLMVGFTPGSSCIVSTWPVATIWQAHQGLEPDWGPAREALAAQRAESAWVWRRGHRVHAEPLAAGDLCFHQAVLRGLHLGPAWDAALAADPDFNFEAWLTRALRAGWLAGFRLPDPTP
jgi:hypothetical protein